MAKINDRILQVAQEAWERALAVDNFVLSGAERERLMSDVLKVVFAEVAEQLKPGNAAG